MDTKFYTLTKIEGDYAYLSEKGSDNEIFIALALLPEGSDVGSNLKWEMFEYTLIN